MHAVSIVRRRVLQETSNLAAVPITSHPPQEVAAVPSSGSGSFPAIPTSTDESGAKKEPSPPIMPTNTSDSPIDRTSNTTNPPDKSPTHQTPNIKNAPDRSPANQTPESTNKSVHDKELGIWVYILIALGSVFLLVMSAILVLVCRGKRGVAVGPWRTGLSGQLQKAFVTGFPPTYIRVSIIFLILFSIFLVDMHVSQHMLVNYI